MPNIILIGGAKRVTLAEQITALFASVGENVKFISVEKDAGFYPISSVASVVGGPSFSSAAFSPFIADLAERNNALPVCCMDAAIPHLSLLRGRDTQRVKYVAHTQEAAQACLDKLLTHRLCAARSLPMPKHYAPGEAMPAELIIKPRRGFGSRGISFCGRSDMRVVPDHGPDFVYQERIYGQETTHDLYVDACGEITISSRDRLAVCDGEVSHCLVRSPTAAESRLLKRIAQTGLFWGPLTVQTFSTSSDDVLITEINARLGGGVTASIAAGAPILEKYFEEAFGIEFPKRRLRQLEMKRAFRDTYNFTS